MKLVASIAQQSATNDSPWNKNEKAALNSKNLSVNKLRLFIATYFNDYL